MGEEKRLAQIEARKKEIREELRKGGITAERAKTLKEETDKLLEEEDALRTALDISRKLGTEEEKPEERKAKESESEKRGRDLKQGRSVTIASTGVIIPEHKAADVKPTFNQVSSLYERVNVRYLPGGESYEQSFVDDYGEADYATEGGNPVTAETTFGKARIGKAKVAAYAEDTEELVKLPAANYDAEVISGVRKAMFKKLNREIINGDGTTGHFTGIFDDDATAIDPTTDISFTEIDETTLDEIIMSYGGDEDVEDVATLILSKIDLKAFKTLRDADGKKVYEIKVQGNTGTIDGVPYIINSKCGKLSAEATGAGTYCMAYGTLSAYEMAVFSDLEITRSTDYKFKEGIIAHRGVIFAGGNVTRKNGFIRVKKGA